MSDLSHLGPEAALRAALLIALTAWVAWWIVALLIAVVDRRTAARFAPPLLRALLLVGAVTITTGPAHAHQATPVGSLDGLRLPDRPTTAAPVTMAVTPSTSAGDRPHVVKEGDCLWSIVRDRSPAADAERISSDVAAWHVNNRDVIGPDPDLIQPGQRLVPPGAS